jgi:ribonuclease P protein component
MLARQFRLRKPREIDRVYAKGNYGGAKTLHVKTLATKLPDSRAAIVVGKKVSKQAVVRNRIRRRVSELMARQIGQLAASYDIVVYVRADLAEVPVAAIAADLTAALTKAGVLERKSHV